MKLPLYAWIVLIAGCIVVGLIGILTCSTLCGGTACWGGDRGAARLLQQDDQETSGNFCLSHTGGGRSSESGGSEYFPVTRRSKVSKGSTPALLLEADFSEDSSEDSSENDYVPSTEPSYADTELLSCVTSSANGECGVCSC